MKIFRFDPEVGRSIDAYHSSGFIISRIIHLFGESVLHCAYLKTQGVIGYHQATAPQLFLIVDGEGWVRGKTPESRCSIKAGQAVFWEKGEWHESGTETGVMAIIIEGEDLDPTNTMPPV